MPNPVDSSAHQRWHTQQFGIEFHRSHKAFCESIELVEKLLAGMTALAPFSILTGALP